MKLLNKQYLGVLVEAGWQSLALAKLKYQKLN